MVGITAAMAEPTGIAALARKYPERVYDVGIAEQHAATSAAGLAMGGLHPVVAVYATFLNRAFDQVLLDVAMHRLPVTFVLDRAGITGPDGPSHYGIWDMSVFGVVPGLRIAAPRDAATLREELREAVAVDDGPTIVRFPTGSVPADLPAVRRDRHRRRAGRVGPHATCCWSRSARSATSASRSPPGSPSRATASPWSTRAGCGRCRSSWSALAAAHRLVVTVEDGVRTGGVGDAVAKALRDAGRAACRCATSACRPAGTRTAAAPRSSPTSASPPRTSPAT